MADPHHQRPRPHLRPARGQLAALLTGCVLLTGCGAGAAAPPTTSGAPSPSGVADPSVLRTLGLPRAEFLAAVGGANGPGPDAYREVGAGGYLEHADRPRYEPIGAVDEVNGLTRWFEPGTDEAAALALLEAEDLPTDAVLVRHLEAVCPQTLYRSAGLAHFAMVVFLPADDDAGPPRAFVYMTDEDKTEPGAC